MKLTLSQLKRIIKEEVTRAMETSGESYPKVDRENARVKKIMKDKHLPLFLSDDVLLQQLESADPLTYREVDGKFYVFFATPLGDMNISKSIVGPFDTQTAIEDYLDKMGVG